MARWPIAFALLVLGGLTGGFLTSAALQGQQTSPPPEIPKELTSYRDIVKRVLPAVVSIEARPKQVTQRARPNTPRRRPRAEGLPPGLPEEFRRFFEDFGDQEFEMPETPRGASFGSGFLIDPKGIILTNFHVVQGADEVKVTLSDDTDYHSRDIHSDPKNDLAIIRIKAKTSLPYLELGNSDAMEIGDRVLAAGAPFGLTGSVTAGIVSAKGRSGLNASRSVYEDYLQTDAAINPGNSGGPLVNLAGQVIGINTAIKSRTGGFQGVGLAIASNVARDIVDQLVKTGSVHRGYLGVAIAPLDPDVAAQLGIPGQKGLVVRNVYKNTPAGKAGIKAGDVITSVEGKPVKDARELQRLVAHLPLHKPVDVTIVRDGKTQTLPVTVEEQPDTFGVASRAESGQQTPEEGGEEVTVDKIGIDLADMTPELAKRFGYGEQVKGVVVTDVREGSLADDAHLVRGMLIIKIGNRPVNTAVAARAALQRANLARGVVLQIQYPERLGGGTGYIMLKGEPANK